jgi:hypothetical protein
VTAKEQRKETEEGKLYKERKEISSIFRWCAREDGALQI